MKVVHPIADWRAAVRKNLIDEELKYILQESNYKPTLLVLKQAHPEFLFQEYQRVITCKPSATNWIRLRLLAGTSALNYNMSRITKTRQSASNVACPVCPVCGVEDETVEHFLRRCSDLTYVDARTQHEDLMPPLFHSMDHIQQAAFILGLRVHHGPKHGTRPKKSEDAASIILVSKIWKRRCAILEEQSQSSPAPIHTSEDEAVDDAEDSPHPHNVFREFSPLCPLSPSISSVDSHPNVEGYSSSPLLLTPQSPLSPSLSSVDSHPNVEGYSSSPLLLPPHLTPLVNH